MATKLTDHASVEQIIREMTVDEKARMVIGGTPFHTEAIPEYGIPAMSMIDSCNGLNSMEYAGGENLSEGSSRSSGSRTAFRS